jgi:hypothetical protein
MTNRQRAFLPVFVLALLGAATACQAHSSVEAAQTAIVAAQTVLPGAQATAQAGATLVSSAFANAQPLIATLQAVLQGVSVQVKMTPEGAAPDAVNDVEVDGVDAQGTLANLDPSLRQAAGTAALSAAAQYFPNATISLDVKGSSGEQVLKGSVAPGQPPSVQ